MMKIINAKVKEQQNFTAKLHVNHSSLHIDMTKIKHARERNNKFDDNIKLAHMEEITFRRGKIN